jgi:hypothetical protein
VVILTKIHGRVQYQNAGSCKRVNGFREPFSPREHHNYKQGRRGSGTRPYPRGRSPKGGHRLRLWCLAATITLLSHYRRDCSPDVEIVTSGLVRPESGSPPASWPRMATLAGPRGHHHPTGSHDLVFLFCTLAPSLT